MSLIPTNIPKPAPVYTCAPSKDPFPHLSETSLLRHFLYAHASNPGQTPRTFYLWAFIGVISAAIANKFYYYKFPNCPLLPNLFTFLVGPSGLGKGTAIGAATDYLTPYKEYLKVFTGRVTHAAWMKYVTTPRGPLIDAHGNFISVDEALGNGSRPATLGYLITEELAWGVGEGDRAKELLKMMTAAYTQTGRAFEEFTNQNGLNQMENPVWGWLAGTTETWLLDAIGPKNMLSGFASRIIWVIEGYDLSKMCAWAVYPQDFNEVKQYIMERLFYLVTAQGGEMFLEPGARFIIDRWYVRWQQQAQLESDKVLLPLYTRGHDLVLKVAMILRAADFDLQDPYRYWIRQEEVLQATKWVENLMLVHYKRLLQVAYKSEDKSVIQADAIGEIIRSLPLGQATRTNITKRAHNKGMNAKVVDESLRALLEQELIELVPTPGHRGGFWRWISGEVRGIKADDWDKEMEGLIPEQDRRFFMQEE